MINTHLISRALQSDTIRGRAQELVEAGCPSYSAAWYRAYDEVRSVSGQGTLTSSPPGITETQPPTILDSLHPRIVQPESLTADQILERLRAREKLAQQAAPAKRPQPKSVAEVLAAGQLDFDALSAYLAVRAMMAYEHPDEIEEQMKAEGADHIANFAARRTAAFGYTLHNHAFLCFRGTISTRQFLLTDMDIIPIGWPPRHLGFNRAWRCVQASIIKWLDSIPQNSQQLVVTGHSLGAALAILAAFDLFGQYSIRAVITFGTPRVGLFPFRYSYNVKNRGAETLHAVTRRYTHETDLVSRIPPPILYCHVGEEWVVHSSGLIEEGRPVNKIVRFEEWWESQALRGYQSSKQKTINSIPTSSLARQNTPSSSRWGRTKLASWKFFEHLKLILEIAHATSLQFLWIASAVFGILWCVATGQDLTRHPSAKYVNAYDKRFPELTKRSTFTSRLLDKMLNSYLKKDRPWDHTDMPV